MARKPKQTWRVRANWTSVLRAEMALGRSRTTTEKNFSGSYTEENAALITAATLAGNGYTHVLVTTDRGNTEVIRYHEGKVTTDTWPK